LLRIEFGPLTGRTVWNWKDTCQRCLAMLGTCIFADRELVLPAMVDAGQFYIVSSVQEEGAQIVERIRNKLDACAELKANGTFQLSATTISRAAFEPGKSIEELVCEVANRVTEMVMADMGPTRGTFLK
jgi:hypothetical protein